MYQSSQHRNAESVRRVIRVLGVLAVALFYTAALPGEAFGGEDRAARAMKKNDRNKDGRVSRKEWRKSGDIFLSIDKDGDGFLSLEEFQAKFAGGKAKKGSTKRSGGRDRVGGDFKRADEDGDGKLSRAEWHRRGNFARLDTDEDGSLSLGEVRVMYAGHDEKSYDWPPAGMPETEPVMDPSAAKDLVDSGDIKHSILCGIGRGRRCHPKDPVDHGLFLTGLGPEFPENAICPGIDDIYAFDYSFKRNREAYHGGIDMPVRWGTPMIAAAAGTVVGKFMGEDSARGIQIYIRHGPEDTGISLWTYTLYAHLDRMPEQKIGQRVKMGEILGPKGNSGVSGKSRQKSSFRRPAIHFTTFYSESPKYAIYEETVIPVDGRWMDPNAIYRQQMPLDSLFEDGKTSHQIGLALYVRT